MQIFTFTGIGEVEAMRCRNLHAFNNSIHIEIVINLEFASNVTLMQTQRYIFLRFIHPDFVVSMKNRKWYLFLLLIQTKVYHRVIQQNLYITSNLSLSLFHC